VPMAPGIDRTDAAAGGPLEIHVYPGRDAAFTLYEDAGDGYGYEAGEFATVDFAWDEAARLLQVGQRAGRYPGMPDERDLIVVLHEGPDLATRDAPVAPRRLCYAGSRLEVQW